MTEAQRRLVFVQKWGAPKPGHEFQYWLAWKHRFRASVLMRDASRGWNLIFRPRYYARAFALWGRAVDRMKDHGRDVVAGSSITPAGIKALEGE